MIWVQYFVLGILLLMVFSYALVTIGMLIGAAWGAPFVPTGKKTVDEMIRVAQIQKGETVFDLGCGDGRFIFAAERAGAGKSVGIEISPFVYLLAITKKVFLTTGKSEIRFGNFFHHKDVREADIIFVFLLPVIVESVFREIWPHMKPGSRIISHAFPGSLIEPDEIIPKTKEHGKVFVFMKKG